MNVEVKSGNTGQIYCVNACMTFLSRILDDLLNCCQVGIISYLSKRTVNCMEPGVFIRLQHRKVYAHILGYHLRLLLLAGAGSDGNIPRNCCHFPRPLLHLLWSGVVARCRGKKQRGHGHRQKQQCRVTIFFFARVGNGQAFWEV